VLDTSSASSTSSLDSHASTDSYILQHALARPLPAPGYSESRKHVLVLHLSNKSTDLFQAEGGKEQLMNVVGIINYYAAVLSREPAAGGTGMIVMC
jgi:hypothetical protein